MKASGDTNMSNDSLVNVEQKKHYMECAMGVPFTSGNTATPLENGIEIFPAMLEAIRQSEQTIEFLTFIYWSGGIALEMAEALAERARSGVKVRVILDAFGSSSINSELIDKMKDAGANVRWFRQIRRSLLRFDWRTHRKILVCDGMVGFTGGVGIASEWEGDARNPDEWRETHFRIQGPAVTSLRGAFWDNWSEVADETVPIAPLNNTTKNDDVPLQVISSHSGFRRCQAYRLLQSMIFLTQKQLDIVTPYFVPDDSLRKLVQEKSESGVRVRILIPGAHTDRRFERLEAARYFSELLASGIEIYLYQKTMLHTKLILSDGQLALFGSINFNRRSMGKDEEIGVVAASEALCLKLGDEMEDDLKDANRIDPKTWRGPNWKELASHWLLTPFRAQL